MSDLVKKLFTKEFDQKKTRQLAKEIAVLLKSKTISNSRVILGEAFYPYKIPVHTEKLYCFLHISEASYRFTAEERPKKGGAVGDFFVSLISPTDYMFAKTHVPEAERVIGVDVFRQPFLTDEEITEKLLSKRLVNYFPRIDLKRVSQFRMNPSQMSVEASYESQPSCIDQTLLLREFITTALEEAYQRRENTRR